MSIHLAAINSGSNGNCYYVGNEDDAVLVDAGISCRETLRRMNRLGLAIEKVKAIFITHEHTDHTRGVEVLSRKYRIPVYITESTRHHSMLQLDPALIRQFSGSEPIPVGGLQIEPFEKWHDAIEPHSFTVHGNGISVGVYTDIGSACERLVHHMGRCHAAFLEANYDEGMLDRGPYPLYLKRRIRGNLGHLSNNQALELFTSHRAPHLSLLILSHLSAQNNHPQLVHELFRRHACGTRIEVASRYEETGVFSINQVEDKMN